MPLSPTVRGAFFMVLATFGFSVMHAMIQYLGKQGLHGFEIAFFRNLFGLFALTPIFIRHGLEPFRTSRLKLHGLRGLVNSVAMLLFFYGVTTGIPLGMVQALSFTAPLFTCLLAAVFLGERMRMHRWSALLIGFAGAMVILRPGAQPVEFGAICLIVSSLLWGVAMIIIKRLTATDSAVTVALYMMLLMGPITGIAASFVWTWPTPDQWPWLVAIGIIGTASQVSFTHSFRLADATAVLPFDFGKLIWSAIIGFLVFSQVLDIWVWIGGAMVFSGGLYIAWRERKVTGKVTKPEVAKPV